MSPTPTPTPSATALTAAGYVPCTTLTMLAARAYATATLLADGRVLVGGGFDYSKDDDAQVVTWETFDPKTDSFADGGKVPGNAWPGMPTRLVDGRVLFLGSEGRALLFDPEKGAFTSAGQTVHRNAYDVAVRLADGRVLFTGGWGDNGFVREAELFDPKTGKFSVTGSMHTARSFAAAALLPDGRVLIAGGDLGIGEAQLGIVLASAELYNPKTGRFVGAHRMPEARSGDAAVPLPGGSVLLVGAYPWDSSPAELYDPRTGRFRRVGGLPASLSESTTTVAVRLNDGRVVVLGGATDDLSGEDETVYPVIAGLAAVYDPGHGTFAVLRLWNQFYEFTATALPDGRVLLVGDGTTALVCAP